jgi:hypothetical protein
MPKAIDAKMELIGTRFGNLIVTEYKGKNKSRVPIWECVCDCGELTSVRQYSLLSGHTKSCGCLHKKITSSTFLKHGDVDSITYSSWKSMWNRCTNKNYPRYNEYKDRTPPLEWRNYLIFLADMGNRPGLQFSLDRIDNSKPYGPENCRWATSKSQARNRSTTTMVFYKNEVISLGDACDLAGLDYQYISKRNVFYKDIEIASNGIFKKAA